MTFIPYGKQCIDQEDIRSVIAVLESDWLTQGPTIKQFEQDFSKKVGSRYAIAVANGTAALHLSLLALGVGPGDEVITTPNSFLATTNAILYAGATPVFVDIETQRFGIDATQIEAAITAETKAILPVHFAGFPVDLSSIYDIADKYNLKIIEDSCHALAANYRDSVIGDCQYSACATFSFHPVKHIATGEGGMITTNDEAMYEKLTTLRTHGVSKNPKNVKQNPGPWYYEMQTLGFNYRMTDMQAALGISQLKKLDGFVTRRRDIAKNYDAALAELDWINPIIEQTANLSSYHLYVVQINFDKIKKNRAEVMNELEEKGIGTQVHYIPIIDQPYYRENVRVKGDFANCRLYYEQALSLPIYPLMSDEDIERVLQAVKALMA